MTNLPQEYRESLFSKFKTFLHDLLWGKKKENIIVSEPAKVVEKKEIKSSIQIMKEENEISRKNDEIIDELLNNPEKINGLSIEKLLRLERVIDQKIAEYEEKIAILDKKTA